MAPLPVAPAGAPRANWVGVATYAVDSTGTVSKKMGLAVTSTKGEEGERTYSVKS